MGSEMCIRDSKVCAGIIKSAKIDLSFFGFGVAIEGMSPITDEETAGKVTSYLLSNSVNPSRNMSYVTNIFILDLFVIQKAKIQINWQLIPKFVTNIYLLWY